MRIFLSYGSEQHGIAEAIALTLRGRGHAVFFDRDGLPPGHSYDDRVARAVARADLFVFLVSPEAVTPGRYTLTEVRHARRRWPNPDGRILPVLIAPTPFESIPNYLRAVTILEPSGAPAADVAAEVDRIASRRRRRAVAIGLALAAFVVASVSIALWLRSWTGEAIEVRVQSVLLKDPGLFGSLPEYALSTEVVNRSDGRVELDRMRLETRPAGRLASRVRVEVALGAGESAPLELAAHFTAPTAPEEVRVCVDAPDGDCGPWFDWRPEPTMLIPGPRPPDTLRESARDVVRSAEALVLAATGPPRLCRFARGSWEPPIEVPGLPPGRQPLAVTNAGQSHLLVASQGSRQLVHLDLDRPSEATMFGLEKLVGLTDGWGDSISSQVTTIADSADVRWVRTDEDSGKPGLFFARRRADGGWGSFQLVPYNDDVSFSLTDLTLRMIGDRLWAAPHSTTPSSLYRFDPESWSEWTGHDVDVVSCATDVGAHPSGLMVIDCEDRLRVIRPEAGGDGDVVLVDDLGRAPGWPQSPGRWQWHLIAPLSEGAVVALNQETTHDAENLSFRSRLALVRGGKSVLLLETGKGRIRALASTDEWTTAIFESPEGNKDVLVFRIANVPRT